MLFIIIVSDKSPKLNRNPLEDKLDTSDDDSSSESLADETTLTATTTLAMDACCHGATTLTANVG